jgi:putative endopeptidase
LKTASKRRRTSKRRQGVRARPVRSAPKFSVRYMDRAADPRKDFYRYAVGSWIRAHPVPPDKSRWGSFSELYEWNLHLLHNIAKRCASDRSAQAGSTPRMVGDFYQAAMNRSGAEAAKFAPVEDLWRLAGGVDSVQSLLECTTRLHNEGVDALFNTFSKTDDKDSRVYAFFLEQGGLSLPDREYYISRSFAKLRKRFLVHVERMFRLKGVSPGRASDWAESVLHVETALAKLSRTRTELRDKEKNYNRTEVSGLKSRYWALELERYLEAVGVPRTSYVVVGQPEYFDAICRLVGERSLEEWRAYLSWHVLHAYAPYLHSAVDKEDFGFFRRELLGQREEEPRWKRAVRAIDDLIGEALGKLYVEEHFPEEARRRASVLVDDLRAVFARRLAALPWMTAPTREQALAKFETFKVKIGHPEVFRDYSALRVDPGDYAGSVRRSRTFEFHRQAARVGGPVDKGEWLMSPPTVNAYFSETENEIVFPAGILQPPFFDPSMDDAVNYGSIGVVMGHEITHGYDDQGRRYDAQGNLKDWWTKDDEREFNKRAREVVGVYSSQEILPGLHVNGELTLGENIADLGGVSIAYEALQSRTRDGSEGGKRVDRLTPEQRFFVAYAQVWRQTITEQELRRLQAIDPHSPARFRATIPALNHPGFDEAFRPSDRSRRPTVTKKVGVW